MRYAVVMLHDAPLIAFLFLSTLGLVGGSVALYVIAKLGSVGRAVCDALSEAPLLDAVVFAFTHGPWLASWSIWWWGLDLAGVVHIAPDRSVGGFFAYLGVAIVSQMIALTLVSWLHELAHPKARKGPRIVHTLNRRVGRVRSQAAVWWTALAVPIFTLVRVGELVIYPPLTWLIRLPRYRAREWVNISRQKFEGLVGWDLIWCLYCDWMTGVWSLGSEMLRNIESFWCPLRFSSSEKCANCALDFPDVNTSWIKPPTGGGEGGMAEVAKLLESQYPGPGGVNAWAGHPSRSGHVQISVKGEALKK